MTTICSKHVYVLANCTELLELIQHTNLFDGPQRWSANSDTGTIGTPVFIQLNQMHFNALLLKQNSRRHAGKTTTDNQDFFHRIAHNITHLTLWPPNQFTVAINRDLLWCQKLAFTGPLNAFTTVEGK